MLETCLTTSSRHFVAVDDILKRIDCTTLAMLSPDDYQVARQRYAALCNGMAKRKRRERKATLASVAKQANKAGIAVAATRSSRRSRSKGFVVTGKSDIRTDQRPQQPGLPKQCAVTLKGINSKRKRLTDGSFKTYYWAWKGGPPLRGEPGTRNSSRATTRPSPRR